MRLPDSSKDGLLEALLAEWYAKPNNEYYGSKNAFYRYAAEQLKMHPEGVRSLMRRKGMRVEPIINVTSPSTNGATGHRDRGKEVFERAVSVYGGLSTASATDNNLIRTDSLPICIVCMADLHLGSSGTDYARLKADIDLILNMPATRIGLVGDVIDNMIVGKLAMIRAMQAEFSISDEWELAKYVLSLIGDKIVFSVAGNHDLWTFANAGIDYLKDLHDRLSPGILYAKYKLPFRVVCGDRQEVFMARHSWRGYSKYNPTHGIESAAYFDKGNHFTVGIGAHTHTSGLAREFNNGGNTGWSILCGSYKRIDSYAEMRGFPAPNSATCVAVIIGEEGTICTSNMKMAARIMRLEYGGTERGTERGTEAETEKE